MKTKETLNLMVEAGKEFLEDDVPQAAAALSFYAVTALPPLVMILVGTIGLVYDDQQAVEQLSAQVSQLLGPSVGEMVSTVFTNRSEASNGAASLLGFILLLVSASGFFAQLQKILNEIWEVRVKKSAGWLVTIKKRLLSMTTVLGTGLLLTFSLILSAVVASAGDALEEVLGVGATVSLIGEGVLNLLLLTALFALIFRYLPDVVVDWSHAVKGAFFTSIVFLTGKFALAFYLGRADLGADYGSAGALVLLLFWVYGSSMLVLFGAELTEVMVRHEGGTLEPENHAEWIPNGRKYGEGALPRPQ